MFKYSKNFLALTLTVTLLVSILSMPLNAVSIGSVTQSSEYEIEPLWDNANAVRLTVDLSNSKIKLSITASGYAGTQFKNGTVTLEKISGSGCGTIKTWNNLSSNSNIFTFSDSSVSRTSGTYRLKISITAVRNGNEERITAQKDASY